MNDDELDQLWCSQPSGFGRKGEDMLAIAIKKTRQFDRTIRTRNRVECLAAAALTVLFAVSARSSPNPLMRVGDLLVAASGLWIIFYIVRYGREAPEPAPDQSLAGFQRALLRKYDHQIRLLKRVKYWYLLPPYAGLLVLHAGIISSAAGPARWIGFAAALLITVMFGAIWWLNEVSAVRRLETEKQRLAQAME